ncbi:hypothetical protein [Rubrivirga sp.]|uniref:hypothetical protein n=1 Tax=Rubrivirga sp. TaxID=1885344 RepID=UPI003B520650
MTTAVAGLSGRTLRFAEVVPSADGPALRRLGAADFDLDAERAVFETGDPEAIEAVAEALAAGLGGTAAEALVVAAHPTATTSFFSRLPVGLAPEARLGQIHQETALLADLAPTQAVRVRARSVRVEPAAGGDREWVHVVHVAEPVHARLSLLADALGVGGYDVADSTRAAAVVAGPGLALVVGAFRGHTEVAVAHDGTFLFGTHGPSTAPADTAYFALAALQQAGAEAGALDRLWVYGDDATNDRLDLTAEFVGAEAAWLDPFGPFRRRPDADAGELAAFAPVLGAAL